MVSVEDFIRNIAGGTESRLILRIQEFPRILNFHGFELRDSYK